jgi:predicted nucleic acid-binding protein/plasmid stability protein
MKRRTVKLPDEFDARLRHEAARRGRTVSELTRDAIDLYLGWSDGQGKPRLLAAGGGRRAKWAPRHLRARRGDPLERARRSAVLIDAGPLYAYIDADDRHHPERLELLETHAGPLLVPLVVVSEVACLVATRLGVAAEVRFLGDLAAGVLTPEPVLAGDWSRIAELTARYGDLPLGTVDASVVTTAERLKVSEVATLDRRHFGVVRSPPAHARPGVLRRPSCCSRSPPTTGRPPTSGTCCTRTRRRTTASSSGSVRPTSSTRRRTRHTARWPSWSRWTRSGWSAAAGGRREVTSPSACT